MVGGLSSSGAAVRRWRRVATVRWRKRSAVILQWRKVQHLDVHLQVFHHGLECILQNKHQVFIQQETARLRAEPHLLANQARRVNSFCTAEYSQHGLVGQWVVFAGD